MERSLSVLLPVRDAQATLYGSVAEILDAAADFGRQFEVLIIDDGSSDATNEAAHELTRLFPQVRLLRHGAPLGREAAIRTGLRHCRGEDVVVREAGSGGFRVIERRARPVHSAAGRPPRPNFLHRVKNFALGE